MKQEKKKVKKKRDLWKEGYELGLKNGYRIGQEDKINSIKQVLEIKDYEN